MLSTHSARSYLSPLERLHVEVGPLDVVLVLPAGLNLLLSGFEGLEVSIKYFVNKGINMYNKCRINFKYLLPAEDHLLPHGGVLLVGGRLLAVALALLAGGSRLVFFLLLLLLKDK